MDVGYSLKATRTHLRFIINTYICLYVYVSELFVLFHLYIIVKLKQKPTMKNIIFLVFISRIIIIIKTYVLCYIYYT
jgi:hypothetical protein